MPVITTGYRRARVYGFPESEVNYT